MIHQAVIKKTLKNKKEKKYRKYFISTLNFNSIIIYLLLTYFENIKLNLAFMNIPHNDAVLVF